MKSAFVFALIAGLAFLVPNFCSAQNLPENFQETESARVYVDASTPAVQLDDQFGKLRPRYSNLPQLSRLNGEYVFGRSWVQLTPEQQHVYFGYLNNMPFKTTTETDYHFRAPGSYPESDHETVIRTEILYAQGAVPAYVDWLVHRNDGGGMTIMDVAIDGVSQNPNHRDEFTPILMHSGGDLDALMNAMGRDAHAYQSGE